jgi:hypothetical protein
MDHVGVVVDGPSGITSTSAALSSPSAWSTSAMLATGHAARLPLDWRAAQPTHFRSFEHERVGKIWEPNWEPTTATFGRRQATTSSHLSS